MNARLLRASLLPFKDAGRKVVRAGSANPNFCASRSDLAEIRAWARENGYEVSDRGRIYEHILAAYDAARAT